jgi:hypothetical protein
MNGKGAQFFVPVVPEVLGPETIVARIQDEEVIGTYTKGIIKVWIDSQEIVL